jgi:hypothetical protein
MSWGHYRPVPRGDHSKWSAEMIDEKAKRPCRECGSPVRWVQARWRRFVYLQCTSCTWAKAGNPAPHSFFDLSTVPFDDSPRYTQATKECAVCKVVAPFERHHLAPRAVFGDAADRWPVVDVCHDCHREWHRLMTDHWMIARRT